MITLKRINIYAFTICFLLYLTCYFRFAGQAILTVTQLISAIILSTTIFSKPKNSLIKKELKNYCLITITNMIILFWFFSFIMWNDFLQVLFVTIIPNLTAVYFFRILIKYEKTQ
ncbi:hypothetical protein B0A68_07010 [Flavobacterium reichenbachii]|uniref:Uncharacterized protein n=1 Tax=Flavobacterium reichenbachii TaxID=362418 RepID=A0A085ZLK7_9FLAO|nr:hypothetical protein IW19_07150 [Flavobacterium reichenbachii]OXB16012.1 hypothetical protein B0A68_07010 [Flavobacterium reichenbachii]